MSDYGYVVFKEGREEDQKRKELGHSNLFRSVEEWYSGYLCDCCAWKGSSSGEGKFLRSNLYCVPNVVK